MMVFTTALLIAAALCGPAKASSRPCVSPPTCTTRDKELKLISQVKVVRIDDTKAIVLWEPNLKRSVCYRIHTVEKDDKDRNCEGAEVVQGGSSVEGITVESLIANVGVRMDRISMLYNLSSNRAYCVAVEAILNFHHRKCSYKSDWERLPLYGRILFVFVLRIPEDCSTWTNKSTEQLQKIKENINKYIVAKLHSKCDCQTSTELIAYTEWEPCHDGSKHYINLKGVLVTPSNYNGPTPLNVQDLYEGGIISLVDSEVKVVTVCIDMHEYEQDIQCIPGEEESDDKPGDASLSTIEIVAITSVVASTFTGIFAVIIGAYCNKLLNKRSTSDPEHQPILSRTPSRTSSVSIQSTASTVNIT